MQRGKMHGTNSAVLQRNFLFAGGIYRPASFFYLNLRMTRIRCTLFPTCRWHVVYCTDCGGVSVLTNQRRGTPARGGPCSRPVFFSVHFRMQWKGWLRCTTGTATSRLSASPIRQDRNSPTICTICYVPAVCRE